jgi:membrane protease YdiL (CAAX protease family)
MNVLQRATGWQIASPQATLLVARHLGVWQTAFLLVGLAAAVALRVVIGGPGLAPAVVAGTVFGVVLLALAAISGLRPSRPHRASIAVGVAGGAVLVALPLLTHPGGPYIRLGQAAPLPLWAAVTVLVATAEEAFLRGALFDAARSLPPRGARSDTASPSRLLVAALVSSVAFALLHVPLYGWHVVPLDLAVGLWLSGLRLVTGGIAAPAIAHVVADLGTWAP